MIQTYTTILTKKTMVSPDVMFLTFALEEPKHLEFQAGQYLVMMVPTAEDPARRLYSICSPSIEKSSFDLIAKIIPGGLASEYFVKLNVGDPTIFEGPAGRFTLKGTQKHKVFLATGTGIAPMRSMIFTDLTTNPQAKTMSYTLLWGLPTFKDVYLLDELKKLQQEHKNFYFYICLSREQSLDIVPEADRSHFRLGRVTKDFTPDFTNTDYYICGNREVVDSLKKNLYEFKIENTSVIFEKF